MTLTPTQESLLEAVKRGEVVNRRVVTHDPARYYRYRWESTTRRLTTHEQRALDALWDAGVVGHPAHPATFQESVAPVALRSHDHDCDMDLDCTCGAAE